ncbi:hypothetical protein STANM309S_03100 [Streptomyces tanashiensis]
MTFYDPEDERRSRLSYLFTVDVSDELPVTLAPVHTFLGSPEPPTPERETPPWTPVATVREPCRSRPAPSDAGPGAGAGDTRTGAEAAMSSCATMTGPARQMCYASHGVSV